MNAVRRLAKRSKTMVIAYHVYDNWCVKSRSSAGCAVTSRSGSTHMGMTLTESLGYINQVFGDYLTYSGLTQDDLRGMRILEVGPGDNLGVAMKFLSAGARKVLCLDKFLSEQDEDQQRCIYQALRESLSPKERERLDNAVKLDGRLEIDGERLEYIQGLPIEGAPARLAGETFDVIVSRAVLEHVYDPDTAIAVMNQLLVPGGLMLHKIDFRDHGLFSGGGQHPLTLWTIPTPLHKRMVYDSGKPNRKLASYYRQKMRELGYEYRLLITSLVGSRCELVPHSKTIPWHTEDARMARLLVEKVRRRLQPEFRDMPLEDLMVSGVFLVARKPFDRGCNEARRPSPALP